MFFKYCQSIKNTDSFCSSSSGQRKTHTQAKGRLAGETDPRTTCRVSAVPRVPDKRRSTSGARGHRRHGWGPTNYHSPPEAGTVTLWALAAATINQASCPHSVSSANQQWAIFPSWLAITASKTLCHAQLIHAKAANSCSMTGWCVFNMSYSSTSMITSKK